MHANWITALISGIILGGAIYASESFGRYDARWVLPVFFFVAIVGVAGIPQMRELHAERRKRRQGIFAITTVEPEDFSRFYFPAWGRMFLWFVSTVATHVTLRTLLS